MRTLVVFCHPCQDSFAAAIRDAVCDAVRAAGHDPDLLDLYAEGFDPVMRSAERKGYHEEGSNLAPVRAHAERLARADAVIFVYPTWWFGLPAMLKGWLDRVLVPGFAFEMPTERYGPRPGLTHIRRVGVFTTCGATRSASWLMGSPGRRTLLRGFRSNCHPAARTLYAAIYKIDTAPAADRTRYLQSVERKVARLLGPSLFSSRWRPAHAQSVARRTLPSG